jgi:transcriptional repressor NrdR
MHCPFCKHPDTKVIDSRDAADALRRRRECLKCAKRFTTYERVETTNLLVVKKDGTREQYDREKLRRGMLLPCEKLAISSERIDNALSRIEQKIATKKGEISSSKLGELVMQELKKLNKVAYIRYAAVYREFADLADFETELSKLLKKTKGKTTRKRRKSEKSEK